MGSAVAGYIVNARRWVLARNGRRFGIGALAAFHVAINPLSSSSTFLFHPSSLIPWYWPFACFNKEVARRIYENQYLVRASVAVCSVVPTLLFRQDCCLELLYQIMHSTLFDYAPSIQTQRNGAT